MIKKTNNAHQPIKLNSITKMPMTNVNKNKLPKDSIILKL